MNRGADYVKHLVPSLRARTRHLTGHREPHNQATLARTAHGAGQHRDYTKGGIKMWEVLVSGLVGLLGNFRENRVHSDEQKDSALSAIISKGVIRGSNL